MRVCKKCEIEKEISEYYLKPSGKPRSSYCKDCHKIVYKKDYNKEYYEKNKEKQLEKQSLKYLCICGKENTCGSKYRHIKTHFHILHIILIKRILNLIKNNMFVIINEL